MKFKPEDFAFISGMNDTTKFKVGDKVAVYEQGMR